MEGRKTWIMGQKFEEWMPHHNGIKALRDSIWEFPVCETFTSAKSLDANTKFQCTKMPTNCKNMNDDYGSSYTSAFISVAERLTSECNQAANTDPFVTL
jgi:hypothetical protein